MTTVMQLIHKRNEIESLLRKVDSRIESIPYASFTIDAIALLNAGRYVRPSDALVHVLVNRRESMTHEEIREAFQLSGFQYTEDDVRRCYPDS